MMPKINLQRWIPSMALLVFFVAAHASGQTATHSCGSYYVSPGTITITNTFSYSVGELKQLVWFIYVPDGWTVTNVQGDGLPRLDGTGEQIALTAGNYTSPVVFTYDLVVPPGYVGPTNVVAYYTDNVTGNFGNDWYLVTPESLEISQNFAPSITNDVWITGYRTPQFRPLANQITEATLRAQAHDADSGDTLTLTSVNTNGLKGVLVSSGGILTYTTPAHTDSIIDTFTYTVTDSRGASAVGTVKVRVAYGGTMIRAF